MLDQKKLVSSLRSNERLLGDKLRGLSMNVEDCRFSSIDIDAVSIQSTIEDMLKDIKAVRKNNNVWIGV